MPTDKIIDAEFVVIDAGRSASPPVRDTRNARTIAIWSFLRDDLPNLVGIAAGLVALFLCRLYLFPHH